MPMATSRRADEADDTLVVVDRFVLATRDSGYRGTASAVAELVDNALQAGATRISIRVVQESDGEGPTLAVLDNGSGMDALTLRQSLRFGGSSRFNDRRGLGRYGMGLPNSSLSQALRVDVTTWQSPSAALSSFLDVDEIATGSVVRVPKPVASPVPARAVTKGFSTGTLVTWSRCDRLDHRRPGTIARKLHAYLGRVFRHFLWRGVEISVNDETVEPFDPLFLHERAAVRGGILFGAPLSFDIELPLPDRSRTVSGEVIVTFSELPVDDWHELSNEEKQRRGVSKGAGVSIVRANREIEYGWFFMGEKRKENYDDWWRCEIRFNPSLDEVFGITHTKQQIRPTQDLVGALVPDVEATAKALNRRVRQAHERLRTASRVGAAEAVAEAKDRLLPPLPRVRASSKASKAVKELERRYPHLVAVREDSRPAYALVEGHGMGTRLFYSYRRNRQVVVLLNTEHPFYKRVYRPLCDSEEAGMVGIRQRLELMLMAAARAEAALGHKVAGRYLDAWSEATATFLQS
jgi:hypothetical protein